MTPIQESFFYTPESIVFPGVYVIILRKSVFLPDSPYLPVGTFKK